MKRYITLVILGFLVGMLTDRVYMVYSISNEKASWERYADEKESATYNNILGSSYGTLEISSTNKNIEAAQAEVNFKVGLAKMHKWSIVGERKIESVNGTFKVSQIAFRLIE